jgi:acyl carrier protein
MSGNSIQEVIIKIWKELLDLQQVGSDDNFLLLGGESLLATQASARLRDAFGLEVPLRSILVGTVAEVAEEIAGSLSSGSKQTA